MPHQNKRTGTKKYENDITESERLIMKTKKEEVTQQLKHLVAVCRSVRHALFRLSKLPQATRTDTVPSHPHVPVRGELSTNSLAISEQKKVVSMTNSTFSCDEEPKSTSFSLKRKEFPSLDAKTFQDRIVKFNFTQIAVRV